MIMIMRDLKLCVKGRNLYQDLFEEWFSNYCSNSLISSGKVGVLIIRNEKIVLKKDKLWWLNNEIK